MACSPSCPAIETRETAAAQPTETPSDRAPDSPIDLDDVRDTVRQLRRMPLPAEARDLVGELADRLSVCASASQRAARSRTTRVQRLERLTAPFVCPYCGEQSPGVRWDGRPRRACPDPRCSGRAGGLRRKQDGDAS